jgi:thiamine-monophosphate kinase
LGIGDDAALLERVAGKLVLSVDTCLEHTHFERDWLSLEQLGKKAIHSAVSDLAAMGARPVAVLSALVLPRGVTRTEVEALARGQAAAAKALGSIVVGGNVTRGRDLSLTTTVIGSARYPISRKGARAADRLWLLGNLGLAAAGLRLLQQGQPRARSHGAPRCLAAWRSPEALVREGLSLVKRAHAAIDVSDGLVADAGHIARASDKRIVIEERALKAALAPELIAVAKRLGVSALELALQGGEDYALLATGTARRKPKAARSIGRVEAGSGVVLEALSGEYVPVSGGFDHLSN